MTLLVRPSTHPASRLPRSVAALLLACAAASASASPADYRCDNGQVLNATMTPRDATLKLDGQQYKLKRVRDRADARFVDASAGQTLTLARSQAEFARKDQPTLVCKKIVASLEPEVLNGGPRRPPAGETASR